LSRNNIKGFIKRTKVRQMNGSVINIRGVEKVVSHQCTQCYELYQSERFYAKCPVCDFENKMRKFGDEIMGLDK